MARDTNKREQIIVAVAIAALSAIATQLVSWGMDRLRKWLDPKEEKNNDT